MSLATSLQLQHRTYGSVRYIRQEVLEIGDYDVMGYGLGRSQWSTKYKIQNSCFVPLTCILDCSGVQKTKN